ncbi:MAG: WG repeat-containing protein [Bacteroidota bacterium]
MSVKITCIFFFFLHFACYSQEAVPENYRGFNSYGSYAEEAGDKWGIRHESNPETWMVAPVYDTIILVNSFKYGISKHKQTVMYPAQSLFILFKGEPGKEQQELHKAAQGVSFDVCKENGEMLKLPQADGYRLIYSHWQAETYDIYTTLLAMELLNKGRSTLLEPGFELYAGDYSHYEKIRDYGLYIAQKTDGTACLLNGRKEVLLSASKIEAYQDSVLYRKDLGQHEINGAVMDIPYLTVTDDKGFRRLYSLTKKKFVTPAISSSGRFTQIAIFPAEIDLQAVQLEIEYEDKGLKGYYDSRMQMGTDCAFLEYFFTDSEKMYASVSVPANTHKQFYVFADKNGESHYITDYDSIIVHPDYYEYGYYGFGLTYRKNGKYGAIYHDNTTDGKLYDTLYLSNQGDYFFSFRENGKFGLTNGKTVIPAVFDNPVEFSAPYITARHGSLAHTQSFMQDGKQLYYDSKGKRHVSENGSYDVRYFGKKMGIVEYYETDDSKFDTLVQPLYKYIDMFHVGYLYTATNKKGQKGLIDLYGDTLIPFEYDQIDEFITGFKNTDELGKLFEVKKGKKSALYSSERGWLTSLDEHSFDFTDNFSTVLIEVSKKTGNDYVYGLNSLYGKVLLEPVYSSLSDVEAKGYANTSVLTARKDMGYNMTLLESLRDDSKNKIDYQRFDLVERYFAYRLNCNTNKIEEYYIPNFHLVSAMSPEEFARLRGYNVTFTGGEYVLEYHDPMKDENQAAIVRLEAIDFVNVDGMPFMVGKKGKVWNMYYVDEGGLYDFETFFYQVVTDSRFLRVTKSGSMH